MLNRISQGLLLVAALTSLSTFVQAEVKVKAFVYTEIQKSIPFNKAPWRTINKELKKQDGIINKTWLSGIDGTSVGGFYAFDSIENAQTFVTNYFPDEARSLGVAQRTLVFDAVAVEEASRDMNSVHFGGKLTQQPGAYVYTCLLYTSPSPRDS